MLFCCHRYFSDTEKRYLDDTLTRTHQFLEFGTCPICGTKRAFYKYDFNGVPRRPQNPKGKKAEKLLQELKNQPYYELKDLKTQHGTKNNMFWLYQTNGLIKDFNNETKGKCDTNIVYLTDTFPITKDTAPLEGAFH